MLRGIGGGGDSGGGGAVRRKRRREGKGWVLKAIEREKGDNRRACAVVKSYPKAYQSRGEQKEA